MLPKHFFIPGCRYDIRKPPEEQTGNVRNRMRWYHFSLVGSVRWMRIKLRVIVDSPTVTEEARELADKMQSDASRLAELLNERTFK